MKTIYLTHKVLILSSIFCVIFALSFFANSVNAQTPAITFSASDTNINSGDSVTLTWSSPAAATCNPTFSSNVFNSGSEVVNPTSTRVYAVTCSTFSMGSAVCSTYSNNETACLANGCFFLSNIECGNGSLGNATCSSCFGTGSQVNTESLTVTVSQPPTITVTPGGAVNFGSLTVGDTADQTFTIENTGGGTLSGAVTNISSPFTCVSGCGTYNLTTGQTQNIVLRYTAQAGNQNDTATFTCTTGCSNVDQNRNLSGTGDAAPVIDINPVPLDFGDVNVGETATSTFMVSNTGGGNLVVNSPTISSTHADVGPGVYSCVAGGCGSVQNIPAGSSMTYTVTYTPTVVSNGQTATLNFTGTIPTNVSLEGNGVTAPPPPSCPGAFDWSHPIHVADANLIDNWGTSWAPGFSQTSFPPASHTSLPNCLSNSCSTQSSGWQCNTQHTETFMDGSGYANSYVCECGSGLTLPTAFFTSPATEPATVTITDGDTVNLQWDSTDADSCELSASGSLFLTSLPTSGSQAVTPSVDTIYSIECSNSSGLSPNSPDVSVIVNPSLNCSMVANKSVNAGVNAGTWTNPILLDAWGGEASRFGMVSNAANLCQTQCNNVGAAYCDFDFQETFDPANPIPTNSGSWTCNAYTSGTLVDQTGGAVLIAPNLQENTAYYASDCGGATPPPPPPAATLEISINGGAWQTTNPTISLGDTVDLQWSSSNAASCVGTNFNTSNLTNGTASGGDVTLPAPGSPLTYTVDCDGATDQITVDMSAAPNLQVGFLPNPTLTPQTDVDGNVTGDYIDVTFQVVVNEVNGVAVAGSFDLLLELDIESDGTIDDTHTITINGIAASGAEPRTYTFNTPAPTMPTTPASQIIASVDAPLATNGVIVETIENDNTATLSPVPSGLPPFTMDLQLDPSDLVRGGGDVDIDYDVNATLDMDCSITGPQLQPTNPFTFNPSTDGPDGILTAGPITAKSVYILECIERVTGNDEVFTESASVETTGMVEEI